jgi:hypothetical protein
MNLGCGFVDTFTTNVAGVCTFGSKPEEPTEVPQEDDTGGSYISGSSANTSSQLTALEKALWTDWDKKEEKPDKKDKKWIVRSRPRRRKSTIRNVRLLA